MNKIIVLYEDDVNPKLALMFTERAIRDDILFNYRNLLFSDVSDGNTYVLEAKKNKASSTVYIKCLGKTLENTKQLLNEL